jgi:Calcineurin-like phosphoesterase
MVSAAQVFKFKAFAPLQAKMSSSRKRYVATASFDAKHADLPDPRNFSDSKCSNFSVAIMGDLHISRNPEELTLFNEARDQLRIMVTQDGIDASRVVQLGDLGNYDAGWPGSSACFDLSRQFLEGFALPTAMVLGNHDVEGAEFETDEENLGAWHSTFKQRHYWSADLGPATLIGLSTNRFRSNPFSVHEVHIDEEQMEFLENQLEAASAANRPVIMFTHAPIMGSGLKAIQAVHVKNRCAWLNHSSNPSAFMQLVDKYPNCVKLWFSGHFHLSQSYPDSISLVGSTAYILTGVIGDHSSRDGLRHSRVLKGNKDSFEVYTVDHDSNSLRLDLQGRWDDQGPPKYMVPTSELLCDPSSGWLCSEIDCSVDLDADVCVEGFENEENLIYSGSINKNRAGKWFNAGSQTMLSLQEEVLVEYDIATMAPIGAVFLNVPEGAVVRLVDKEGRQIDAVNGDGCDAVAVEIIDPQVKLNLENGIGGGGSSSADEGVVVMRAERNDTGCFYQIFQQNKWVAKKRKEAEEAARLAAGAVA